MSYHDVSRSLIRLTIMTSSMLQRLSSISSTFSQLNIPNTPEDFTRMVTATPRWTKIIEQAISEHKKSTVYQLSSIDVGSPTPQVRSVIHREFLLPPLSNSPPPDWPSSGSIAQPKHITPLLLTTTDVRTPKVAQLISNPRVQLAWWIEGTQEQFRISGTACVLPKPSGSASDGPGMQNFQYQVKHAPKGSGLGIYADSFGGSGSGKMDWERKRVDTFKNMSAHMKASWCRPPPGSKLKNPEDAKKWPERLDEPIPPKEDADEEEKQAYEETKKNWETALNHFALLLIDPNQVDYVELGVVPNRRTRFWRKEDGSWGEEALVP